MRRIPTPKAGRLHVVLGRFFFDNLPYANPSNAPRISVITHIGTNDNGSFHPMMNTFGNKQINGMTIPFNTGCSLKLDVANKKPETIQRKKADRLASQVSRCNIMGITSSTPATAPRSKPMTMLFFNTFVLSLPILRVAKQVHKVCQESTFHLTRPRGYITMPSLAL